MKNKIKIIILILLTVLIINPFTINLMINLFSKDIKQSIDDYQDITSTGEVVDDNDLDKIKKSSVEWKIINFNTKYYPFYGMISDNEKKLYNQIYANINALNTTFSPDMTININELKNAFEAIFNDHPELFWINTSYKYKYTKDNNVVQIELSFNKTSKDINKYKKYFDAEANKIINSAKNLSTNYEREKYVYDKIVTSVVYDKNSSMNQSAYSALVNKKTICAGYSRAFQYIMIKLGIPTYYVSGVANVNHAWNIVKLDDGYYNVDLTWGLSNIVRYTYFNKTDSYYGSSHKRTGLSVNLPKCNSTKYTYVNTNTSNSSKNITTNSNTNKSNSNSNNVNTNTTTKSTTTNSNNNIVIIKSNETENSSNSNETTDTNIEESNSNGDSNIEQATTSNEESVRRKKHGRFSEGVYSEQ